MTSEGNTMNRVRASFTLPPEVVRELDYVSRRLGATKSSIVSEVLSEALGPLSELLRAVPEGSTVSDADGSLMRFRGVSGDIIRDRLNSLRDLLSDIDPDSFELVPCADRPAGCSCDYSSGQRVPPRGGCLVHGSEEG